jgi:hypothetical protein
MKYILSFSLLVSALSFVSAQCISVSGCPGVPQEVCDQSANDANLWSNNWYHPVYQQNDLADANFNACVTATETCTGGALTFKFKLYLDLDGDNFRETLVDSENLPAEGMIWYNNVNQAGTLREFDSRPVSNVLKYQFAVQVTNNGASYTACLKWLSNGNYSDVQLPYGSHQMQWVVENGSGQLETCTYEVLVKDCKSPVIVCLNGLSVNIMQTGEISIWATDFLQYHEDNYSTGNHLKLATRKAGTGSGFPVDGQGLPVLSLLFDCSELGPQSVELWSQDQFGNADYCTVTVLIQDQMGNCPGSGVNISVCAYSWCDLSAATNSAAYVSVTAPSVQSLSNPFGANGCSNIAVPLGSDITVTPAPASTVEDPLDGLDALDAVYMARHILGLEPLPLYGMIAADVNRSGSVTNFDIVEFRKLLFGLYATFPSNTTWRYVDSSFVFPNPGNPFQVGIPETISLSNVTEPAHFSFVAIKTGDVDCSANPYFKSDSEDRGTPLTLHLPDAWLKAGETLQLPLYLSDDLQLLALQAGFQYDPALMTLEIANNRLPGFGSDSYTTLDNELRLLWFDTKAHPLDASEPFVTLQVRALREVHLSEILRLSAFPARAYDAATDKKWLQLAFDPTPLPKSGWVQVMPNPTSAGVQFSVPLIAEQEVLLQVFDMRGAQVYAARTWCPGGTATLHVPAEAMPATGVYTWRLVSAEMQAEGRILKQ